MRARLVSVLLLGLAMVACGDGGISRDRAIELALQAGGDSLVPPSVVAVDAGPLSGLADPGVAMEGPGDRQVWAITLAGDFRGECVMAADGTEACPPGARSKLVVLDRLSGELLYSASP